VNNPPLASRLHLGSLVAAAAAILVALTFPALGARSGYWIAALITSACYLAYRSHQHVLSQIEEQQRRGDNALDPTVVDAFVRAYPVLAPAAETIGGSDRDPVSTPQHPVSLPAAEAQLPSSALHEISVAHREIQALYEIAQAMSRGLGVPDTMMRLAEQLSTLVPLSACAVFVPGDDAGTIGCRFATGVDAERIQRLTMRDGRWSTQWAAGSRFPRPEAPPDANLEGGDDAQRTVLASALVYPLIFNEGFVGMLAVYHTDPAIYTSEHGRLFGYVCEQAAPVIHHAIVFEQTQEDSLRDPLTGLPNARYLFIHLARELARAERLRTLVSLLVLDLDAFKEINDSYGHQVGDRALRAVAVALRATIRRYDLCVRYAGDEFVVVLSGCGREEAEQRRLDLQHAVDKLRFEISPGQHLPLAISVGLAVFPQDGAAREELLAAADRRMYTDKTSRKRGAVPL
jgi:diguanylate cyclase (GGDEF)-like protein